VQPTRRGPDRGVSLRMIKHQRPGFCDAMPDFSDGSSTTLTPVQALARVVIGDGAPHAILARACGAAQAVIPGADEVSVTVLEDRPRTVAATGQLAIGADELQYRFGQGPCLDAARTGLHVLVNDVRAEGRWPDYAPAAADAGVGASLSVPLEIDGSGRGALNIYVGQRAVFPPAVVDIALELARFVDVVTTLTGERTRALVLAEQMEQAMHSRAVIEQAKGVIMRGRGCTAGEAFEVLTRMSQKSHVKLRDLCERLVDQVGDLSLGDTSIID